MAESFSGAESQEEGTHLRFVSSWDSKQADTDR